ncbi:hypothetical protein MRB53_025431 [Persea americana]|uniref:Uncharacterized protein n=1 Tax=Persea americana TaxID=3435 RepID=A0ACC2LFI4_PERAE|nr:hypothetical protein MRB53_025431 [Persea americana]
MALSLSTNRQLTYFPPISNSHSTLLSPSSFPSSPPINDGLISSRCIRWRMRDKFPSRNRESNPRVSGTERRGLSRVCGFRSEESGSGIHSGESESESEEEDDEEEMGDSAVPERWDVLGLGQAMVDFSGVVDDDFLERLGLEKGTRKIVNHEERGRVLRAMDGCSHKAAAGGVSFKHSGGFGKAR